MTDTHAVPHKPDAFRCWYCKPYGAPTASSEVSRIEGFYQAAALTALAAFHLAVSPTEEPARRSEREFRRAA